MSNHPLDISGLLNSKQSTGNVDKEESPPPPQSSESATDSSLREGVRIDNQYWDQLNQESRRMLTSRIWKGIDFNPMLAELVDLSRITEKWLKWAVPTYVNGVKGGPIKDWLEGINREKDFHYVLVGEHLRHLKELREKRKQEQETSPEPMTAVEETTPADQLEAEITPEENQQTETPSEIPRPELEASIETLDGHIRWFKQYLQERET